MSGGSAAPWGAIFDWDGVVIDSSRAHEESWDRLARETGRALPPDHFKRGFGMKNEVIIPGILKWTDDSAEIRRLSLRKEELYREVVRERGLQPLPGVRELLAELRARGIPCVVGSSTHRENIELSLGLLKLGEVFSALVTAEDVKHGKPDPEVFLCGAQKLGLEPGRCVVFEDAFVGIEAAHCAGMRVVAVATTNPLSSLGDADMAVAQLDGNLPGKIDEWFR